MINIYIYIYIYIYHHIYIIYHQKHHLSRSFLQKKAYKTTKILEIRLVDISSLLVKDFVRATDQAAKAVTIPIRVYIVTALAA